MDYFGVEADWMKPAPKAWVDRLREISPVSDRLAHLVFRWNAPKDFWVHPNEGQWELYAASPRHLATEDRKQCFEKHWSELPRSEQAGRKSSVSSYQHYMWHTHNVDVSRYAILQGPTAFTPSRYTMREKRYLDAVGAESTPFPRGFFPAAPFDERTVRQILSRDRLLLAGGDLDRLEAMDKPEAVKAEFEEAEQHHRREYLKSWSALMAPCQEYMKSQLFRTQVEPDLPPAPEGLADRLATWKETFIESGHLVGGTNATTTRTNRLVTA